MQLSQAGILLNYPERVPLDVPYQSYTPTFGGFSVAPTVVARYVEYGGLVHLWITASVHGTSNTTTANSLTFTLPYAAANTFAQNCVCEVVVNNGARQSAPGFCLLTANSSTATVYRDSTATATWTGSGNKSFNLSITYEKTGSTGYNAYTPSFGGVSVDPVVTARYTNQNGKVHLYISTVSHGTSNSTAANGFTCSLPITSYDGAAQTFPVSVIVADTGRLVTPGLAVINSNSTTMTIYRNSTQSATWASSGNKSFNLSIVYEAHG